MNNIVIVKKDGTLEPFKTEKIKKAVSKSAARVMVNFTESDLNNIVNTVLSSINEKNIGLSVFNNAYNHTCVCTRKYP